MCRPLIPELSNSERLIGTETLEAFIDVSWRCWTHCSGMKRPHVWQFVKRRAYRKLVKMNQDIMLDMFCRGDFEDCFMFAKNVEVVHQIRYRKDFCKVMQLTLPFRRQLFLGNDCIRHGMIPYAV